jgi:hypothetical protein
MFYQGTNHEGWHDMFVQGQPDHCHATVYVDVLAENKVKKAWRKSQDTELVQFKCV